MADLTAALLALRPGVSFANRDGSLVGIRWDSPGVTPPTQAEIDAELAKPARVTVSRLRLKLELIERDLLAKVEQAVQAAGATPQLYWAEATEFESDHRLVQQIGAVIGLSAGDIAAMFRAAATRAA